VPELLESVGPYPINLLGIVLKSPNLNILSALGTAGALPDIMFYDFTGVYRDHDDETLVSYAKRLKVNKDFYNVVMEPAASVTLNNPDLVSAAEMLTFMQLYFLGHPKAFHRKITTVDHGPAVIEPMADHIITYGGEVKVGEPVNGLRFKDGLAKGCVGEKEDYDYVILAADIPGAKKIVNASTADDAASQKALKGLQDGLGGMKVAPVYHILRVWFDKATDPNRPFNQAVIETPRSPVHLIGLFHMLEQECKDWVKSRPNGEGSVVEFHLYNAPKTPGLAKKGLTAEEAWKVIEEECWRILPELKRQGAKPLSMTMGTFENFTSYEVGQASVRPDSLWPSAELGLRNLTLAGDWIATPYPSALMERSVCSAREAANKILVDDNVLEVPLRVARSKGPGVFPRF
jgi:isorenieratene synthase